MFMFIDSQTNKENRTSEVIVKHKGKFYKGTAKCHPDDEWSEITGCVYAEMRANLAGLKEDYKIAKAKCDECRKFVNAVQCYKDFNKDDPSARAMYRQLNRRIKEVNNIVNKINTIEFALKLRTKTQESLKKRIKDKKD